MHRPPKPIDITQLDRLRSAGLTIPECAAFIGRSVSGVNKALARAGMTNPRAPGVQLVRARKQVADVAPVATPHGAHNPFGI